MGVYGYEKNTTPNIDEWAKDATVFTNARTVIPMTYPSFAALMTGKDPFITKINRNFGDLISDNNITLASIFKKNVFKTAAFTTGAVSESLTNLNQGVDDFNYLTFKS